jgi:hypothetical protein
MTNNQNHPVPIQGPDLIGQGGERLLNSGATIMQMRTDRQAAMALRNEPRNVNLIRETLSLYAQYAKEDFFYYWIVRDKDGRDTVVKGLSIQAATQALQVWGDISLETTIDEIPDGYIVNPLWLDLRTNVSYNRPYIIKKKTVQGNYDSGRAQEMAVQVGISKAQRNVITKMIPIFVQTRMLERAMGEVMSELDEQITQDGRPKVVENLVNELLRMKAPIQFICQKYGMAPGSNAKEVGIRNPKVEIEILVSIKTDIALIRNGEYQVADLFTGEEKFAPETAPAAEAAPVSAPVPFIPAPPADAGKPREQRKPPEPKKPAPVPAPKATLRPAPQPEPEPAPQVVEPEPQEMADEEPFGKDPSEGSKVNELIPPRPDKFEGNNRKWWEFLEKEFARLTKIKDGELIMAAEAVNVLGMEDSSPINELIKAIFYLTDSSKQNKIFTNLKKAKL